MTRTFEVTRWVEEIMTTFHGYLHIDDVLHHPWAMEAYFSGKAVVFKADWGEEVRGHDQINQSFHNMIKEQIEDAINVYARQMVVVAATYIELMLTEFLEVLFQSFPERMYNFVYMNEANKGSVSLRDIVKHQSMATLVESLSEQAANNVMKGKFRKSLENIDHITQRSFPNELRQRLCEMVEQRNRIVHEAAKEKVTVARIHAMHLECLRLIHFLSQFAASQNVPLDDENVNTELPQFIEQVEAMSNQDNV